MLSGIAHGKTSPPELRKATAADIPHLAGVLARAFATDPFAGFLARPGEHPAERQKRATAGWAGLLRYNSDRLSDTYTTADRAGVALWLPPGRQNPPLADRLRIIPSVVRWLGLRRLPTIGRVLDTMERRHRVHMPEPHFYLLALGVDPARQGQGIGSALMQPVLDRCDRDHTPAYLETARERNLPLYERHGFRVVEELTLPGISVRGWLMRRDPKPSAGHG